jgi:putative transposase
MFREFLSTLKGLNHSSPSPPHFSDGAGLILTGLNHPSACCAIFKPITTTFVIIPTGLKSFSPALTRQRLRRVNAAPIYTNPERVESYTGLPQSLAKIIVHIVFSTKDRRPFLRDKPLREELHRYLGGILTNLDGQPIIIGGVEDHVHILSTLSRTGTAAEMVKEAKRGSSLWLKTKSLDLHDFAWQNGYGIFSIGYSQVEEVRKYIAGQEEHHRIISFQDEFRKFLERYAVGFDERYVWD